jgi:hypothetical protein
MLPALARAVTEAAALAMFAAAVVVWTAALIGA